MYNAIILTQGIKLFHPLITIVGEDVFGHSKSTYDFFLKDFSYSDNIMFLYRVNFTPLVIVVNNNKNIFVAIGCLRQRSCSVKCYMVK
jgi:hypothetical protein